KSGMKRDIHEPPSLAQTQSIEQTPVYEVVDGKMHIYFKPDKPTVRVGGQTFAIDEVPSIFVNGRKESVRDIF
ncbi:MAG: hypothetical protein KGH63_01585, partial [Candidatus Micrarchaeota archaeon]|nr:hypothetical protein [Candidatus Micrarchaeota archaeon]